MGASRDDFTKYPRTPHLFGSRGTDDDKHLGARESAEFLAHASLRFLFYRGALSSLHYVPREEFRCRVTIMSGLPGAGKDTWLANHRPDLPVVSLDEVLDVEATEGQGTVIQQARERCRELLRAGRDFAFNATNTMRLTRKRWIDLFADYQARIEIVYLEPPLTTILNQNRRRPSPVPEAVIERLVDKLEPPTWTEEHALILGHGEPECC